MALGTTGQPQTTTYTLANTLAGTGIVLASSSSQFWTATSSTGGTLSAQVTDLGNSTSANTGTAWLSIHGSVNATLQAQSGTSATGTVTVVASF
jgi:hypothetical protein